MSPALPQTGITLYSFTPDFHAGRMTLEDLFAKAAELDMGPGLEIIGFQSIRGFPTITPEFERHFKGLLDRHGFEPSCLDCNADKALRSDRLLSDDELYEYLAAQLNAADRLGFPTARMQWTAGSAVLTRLVPLAEQVDVRMGVEIHAPETVDSPWVLELRDWYAKHQSPYLGFVTDFGSTTAGLSPSLFDAFRAKGVSEDALQAVSERWHSLSGRQFEAHEEIGAFMQLAMSHGVPPDQAINLAVFAVGIHGHGDPRMWLEIADQIVHVHAKFFNVTEDLVEPAVPVADTVRVLIDAGYTGYISSEYEGWHWDTTSDAWEMIRREQQIIRGVLEEAAAVAS
jgi:sugar phosphate isomerase/epimerase